MGDPQDKEVDFEISFYEGLIHEKPDYVEALIPLAEAYTQKGLYQKGLLIDKRLAKLCPEDSTVFYNLACSYALTGKKSQALETLKKAISLGYDDWQHLRKDHDLKSLVGDPQFEAITAGLKNSRKENYG